MLDAVSEGVIQDAMQDLILKDILVEIIENNEVSKLADNHVDDERLANFFAEDVMRDTVIRMLREDVAQPLLTVADTEKNALSSAVVENLRDFSCIAQLTREVAKDCINEELAKKVYESTIEEQVLRDMIEEEVAIPSLKQAGRE